MINLERLLETLTPSEEAAILQLDKTLDYDCCNSIKVTEWADDAYTHTGLCRLILRVMHIIGVLDVQSRNGRSARVIVADKDAWCEICAALRQKRR